VPGLFVVFEGIDGSGKSTLSSSLTNRLGKESILFREPSHLPGGLLIREKLKAHSTLSQTEWLELFSADRRSDLAENIEPELKKGMIVVLDRYMYSTAAYQGQDDQLTAVEIIKNQRQEFPEPDLLFYLRIAPGKALARLQKTRAALELFETQKHLERISNNYDSILPSETIILDGEQVIEENVEQALGVISRAKRGPQR